MKHYKLEARYRYLTAYGKRSHKTRSFYFQQMGSIIAQMKYELSLGAKISIKEISEAEYVKGIRGNV